LHEQLVIVLCIGVSDVKKEWDISVSSLIPRSGLNIPGFIWKPGMQKNPINPVNPVYFKN